MTDAAALIELRRMVDQVAELRQLVQRLVPEPVPGHEALLQALAGAFPAAFSSAEVLDLAANPLSTREPLRRALSDLGACNSHKLGMRLAEAVVSTRGQPLRLVRVKREAGAVLWQVEGAR